jgi:hypothetical protein
LAVDVVVKGIAKRRANGVRQRLFAAITLIAAILLAVGGAPTVVHAGAYIFAGDANGINVVTHPSAYTGSGGSLNVTI